MINSAINALNYSSFLFYIFVIFQNIHNFPSTKQTGIFCLWRKFQSFIFFCILRWYIIYHTTGIVSNIINLVFSYLMFLSNWRHTAGDARYAAWQVSIHVSSFTVPAYTEVVAPTKRCCFGLQFVARCIFPHHPSDYEQQHHSAWPIGQTYSWQSQHGKKTD